MVWYRYARIRTIWRCFTTRGYTTKYHVVGVAIRDEYEKRPIEDIDTWAGRLGDFVANKMCENSCQSLSTSVFCDKTSLEVEVVYTSETLVVKPIEKKEEVEVVEEKEKVKIEEKLKERIPTPLPIPVPRYILEQISYLEERYKEAETVDEKMAIREEIDSLKKRYSIK